MINMKKFIGIMATIIIVVIIFSVCSIAQRQEDSFRDEFRTETEEGYVFQKGEQCVLLDYKGNLYTVNIQANDEIQKEELIATSVEDVIEISEFGVYYVSTKGYTFSKK